MVGMIKEQLRKTTTVDISDIESVVMPHILINERLFATYKVANDYHGAQFTVAKIRTAKNIMWSLYCRACVRLVPEAEAWLKHRDTVDDMAYLGEWCDYWYNWKQRVDYDQEQHKWVYPVSDNFSNFIANMYNGTCEECMFYHAGEQDATCLCHVKEHLYDLPQWRLYRCSHFVRDEVVIDDDAKAAGIDPKVFDDEDRPEYGELASRAYAVMNKRHQQFYEEQNCPVYGPEPVHMVMEEDVPELKGKVVNDKDTICSTDEQSN